MNVVLTFAQVWCVELLLETPGIRPLQMPGVMCIRNSTLQGLENLRRVATVFRNVAIDFRGNKPSECVSLYRSLMPLVTLGMRIVQYRNVQVQ